MPTDVNKVFITKLKDGNLRCGTASTKSINLLIKWSRDKWRALYLQFHNAYGHQTWQSVNLR